MQQQSIVLRMKQIAVNTAPFQPKHATIYVQHQLTQYRHPQQQQIQH